jgi:hypothetical protein
MSDYPGKGSYKDVICRRECLRGGPKGIFREPWMGFLETVNLWMAISEAVNLWMKYVCDCERAFFFCESVNELLILWMWMVKMIYYVDLSSSYASGMSKIWRNLFIFSVVYRQKLEGNMGPNMKKKIVHSKLMKNPISAPNRSMVSPCGGYLCSR